MAWHCGLETKAVSIKPSNKSLGHVIISTTPEQHKLIESGDLRTNQAMILSLWGGLAADYMFWELSADKNPGDEPTGHFNDQQNIQNHLLKINHQTQFERQIYLSFTLRIVSQSQVWNLINEVAFELNTNQEISKTRIAELESKCQKITQDDWEFLDSHRALVLR